MNAPFSPSGFAVSESAVTPGGGVRQFVLQTMDGTPPVLLPDGYFVQAVNEDQAEQWVIGQCDTADNVTINLLIGTEEGVDWQGDDEGTRWRLHITDKPRPGVPLDQCNGLELVAPVPATNKFEIGRGAVRDSSDSLDLVLDAALQKEYTVAFAPGANNGGAILSATLVGTITCTNASAAVSGSGTAFLTDFKKGSTFTTAGSRSYTVLSVADDTNLTLNGLATATETGVTYQRGGHGLTGGLTDFNGDPLQGMFLMRNDADGSVEGGVASFNAAGTYDTQTGYTYKRQLGVLHNGGGNTGVYTLFPDKPRLISCGGLNGFAAGACPLPPGYSRIRFVWDGVSSNTASRAFLLQASADGVTYDTTLANYPGTQCSATSGTVAANGVASLICSTAAGIAAAATTSGVVEISGYDSTAFGINDYKLVTGSSLESTPIERSWIGRYKTTSRIAYLKWLWNGSGAFDNPNATYELWALP